MKQKNRYAGLKYLLFFALIGFQNNEKIYAQHTVAQQWHFSADNGGSQDWILGMLVTDKKEYIGVGYSGSSPYGQNIPAIFKLDHNGKLAWGICLSNFTAGGVAFSNSFGFFRQVVKTTNGYVAVGTVKNTSGIYETLLVEFDENGNFINNTPFVFIPSTLINSIGQTIAMDPSNHGAYIVGGDDGGNQAFLSKIDYNTQVVTSQIFGPSSGGSSIKKLLTEGTSSSYSVYACGFKSMTGDNTSYSSTNSASASTTVITHNKDIWIFKTDNTLTTSTSFDVTYNKTDLGSILYTDCGPLTARNITTSVSAGYNCPAAAYLQSAYNTDERAYDMIFTQDGNIALTAMVNVVATGGNGDAGDWGDPYLIQSTSTAYAFADPNPYSNPSRAGNTYDEYFDGDVYILKIDKSAGRLTATGCWNKNVGHFSGGDWHPHLIQLDQGTGTNHGDFVVAGTTYDYYNSTNDPDLVLGDEYDALLVATHDCDVSATISNSSCFNNISAYNTPYDVWRRNTHAHNEDGLCVFDIKRTADDGFVICGNNDNDGDDFTIIKFSPTLAPQMTYDITGTYTLSSNETWTSNKTIAASIVIPTGKTLTINGATISFASSDHLYDYSELVPGGAGITYGIIVQTGGHLVIENGATLQGLNLCGQRMMWDGIVVEGDPTSTQSTTYQGTVDVNTGSNVNDAQFGIIAGNGYRDGIWSNVNYTNSSGYTLGSSTASYTGGSGSWTSVVYPYAYNSYGGAILTLNGANFLNCHTGISISSYPNSNTSTISNSTFNSNSSGLADVCTYTDANGNLVPSAQHIFGTQVSGIDVEDNTFTCYDGFVRAERPIGIATQDAGMLVTWTSSSGTGNTFSNLLEGIQSTYSAGQSSINMRISHNTFSNNGIGIDVAGNMNALQIGANTFNVPSSSIQSIYGTDYFPGPWTGVRLAGCHGYDVSTNTFNGVNYFLNAAGGLMFGNGIIVNGGDGSYNEKVYNNAFSNICFAAVGLGYNACDNLSDGLQFKCNDFSNYTLNDICRISQFQNGTSAVYDATLREPQGDCHSVGAPDYYSAPAGNRFLHSCSTYTHTWLYGSTEYIYADNNVAQEVHYHGNNASTSYDAGSCIISTIGSTTVTINDPCNVVGTYTHSDACPDGPSYIPYSPALHNTLTALDEAMSEVSTDDPSYPSLVAEHDYLLGDVVRNYAFAGSADSAGAILESYSRYDDAFPFYVQAGDFTSASRVYGYLSTSTDNQKLYKYLAGKALDLYSAGHTWLDLDTATQDSLTKVVQVNRAPGYMAGAVTNMLKLRVLDWPIPKYDSALYAYDSSSLDTVSEGRKTSPVQFSQSNASPSFIVFPNPTSGGFNTQAASDGKLYLYNAIGQVVYTYNINAGTTVLQLPQGISPGIYTGQYKPVSGLPAVIKILFRP